MDKRRNEIITNYNLLKSIKPRFFQTKFPYHDYKQDKPLFTDKVIDILIKTENDKANNEKPKKGGNEHNALIIIYG